MFRPEPRIPFVPARREQVVSLVASINQPQVSVPGKPSQTAQGHLCVIRNANRSVSVYVNFHLTESRENVVYVHERPQLPPDESQEVTREGVQLLESMGFILDDLRFENLSPAAQEEALGRVPLFAPPAQPAAAGASPADAPAAALARLLASF